VKEFNQERWDNFHAKIRENGIPLGDDSDFFISLWTEDIQGLPNSTITYLSVGKDNRRQVPEGLYMHTNLYPTTEAETTDILIKIGGHLAKKIAPAIGRIGGHEVYDLTAMIKVKPLPRTDSEPLVVKFGNFGYLSTKKILDELCPYSTSNENELIRVSIC